MLASVSKAEVPSARSKETTRLYIKFEFKTSQ